jgi:hypothetical protein
MKHISLKILCRVHKIICAKDGITAMKKIPQECFFHQSILLFLLHDIYSFEFIYDNSDTFLEMIEL